MIKLQNSRLPKYLIKSAVIFCLIMPAAPCQLAGVGRDLITPASGAERQRCPDSLPPPPKPQQRAGGESFPPLPLPVTPLRRTEKKKPPSPPVFIAKLNYGHRNWATNKNDANNLLRWFESVAGFRFGWRLTGLGRLTSDIPVVYVSGWDPLLINRSRRTNISQYLKSGGFMIITPCCLSDEFRESAFREIANIFPDRKLAALDIDHPLYRSFYDITKDKLTRIAVEKGMVKEIKAGWRTVLIYSEFDLGRGWISKTHTKTCQAYKIDDKEWLKKFGINMIAYVLATRKIGQVQPEPVIYSDDRDKASSFTIAQVIHSGKWDPALPSISSMLKAISEKTGVSVDYDAASIKLTSPALFSYPFLYLTGYGNFKLSKDEVTCLRYYLANGGFLLADSADGREVFDMAFRREIRKVLPEFKLSGIPYNHPVYKTFYNIGEVDYSEALKVKDSNLAKPRLEGIIINGNLAVVYSRDDLRYGWEFNDHPYRRGYSPSDSLHIATNVVMYALTH